MTQENADQDMPVVRVEVYDEVSRRHVGVTYQPSDPERLMFYTDRGGHVISATAFRAISDALDEEAK